MSNWIVVDGANVCTTNPEDPGRIRLLEHLAPAEARKHRVGAPTITLLRSIVQALLSRYQEHEILIAMDRGTWQMLLTRAGFAGTRDADKFAGATLSLEDQLFEGIAKADRDRCVVWVLPPRARTKAADTTYLTKAFELDAIVVSGDGYANMVNDLPWLVEWSRANRLLYATAAGRLGWEFTAVNVAAPRNPKPGPTANAKNAKPAGHDQTSAADRPHDTVTASTDKKPANKPAKTVAQKVTDAVKKVTAKAAAKPAGNMAGKQKLAVTWPKTGPDAIPASIAGLTPAEKDAFAKLRETLEQHIDETAGETFKSPASYLRWLAESSAAGTVLTESCGIPIPSYLRGLRYHFRSVPSLSNRQVAAIITEAKLDRFAVCTTPAGRVVMRKPEHRLQRRLVFLLGDPANVSPTVGIKTILDWAIVDPEMRGKITRGELTIDGISAVVNKLPLPAYRKLWGDPADPEQTTQLREAAIRELAPIKYAGGTMRIGVSDPRLADLIASRQPMWLNPRHREGATARSAPPVADAPGVTPDNSTAPAPAAWPAPTTASPRTPAGAPASPTRHDTPPGGPPGTPPPDSAEAAAAEPTATPAAPGSGPAAKPVERGDGPPAEIRAVPWPGPADDDDQRALHEALEAAAHATSAAELIAQLCDHPAGIELLANPGIPLTAAARHTNVGPLLEAAANHTATRPDLELVRSRQPSEYWLRYTRTERLRLHLDHALDHHHQPAGWQAPPALALAAVVEWLTEDVEHATLLDTDSGVALTTIAALEPGTAHRYQRAFERLTERLDGIVDRHNTDEDDSSYHLEIVDNALRFQHRTSHPT